MIASATSPRFGNYRDQTAYTTTGYVTVDNTARSITANLTNGNPSAACTITNTRKPTATLTLQKQMGNPAGPSTANSFTLTASGPTPPTMPRSSRPTAR